MQPSASEMKIINQTSWRADQLRMIVNRVASEELDPEHRKRAIVRIEYRGRNRCLGRGQIGRSPQDPATTIWIYVERPEHLRRIGKGWCGKEGCGRAYQIHRRVTEHSFVPIPIEPRLNGPQIARVVAHEFQHNLGRGHRQMHSKYLCHDHTPWSWAGEVEPAPPPSKPSPAQVTDFKLIHATEMLRKAETRAKRASTILKKWRRRVRDTARRAAGLRREENDADRSDVGQAGLSKTYTKQSGRKEERAPHRLRQKSCGATPQNRDEKILTSA